MVESVDFYRRKFQDDRAKGLSSGERIAAALPTDSSVEGMFLVDGAGESLKLVNFPVRFIQRPSFTTGGEMHLDSRVVGSTFPTMSCVVNDWLLDPPEPTDYSKVYFVGAQLAVVTTGPRTQRMWIHWRASGKAIVNPGNATGLTTGSTV